jgi:hypothetical protein
MSITITLKDPVAEKLAELAAQVSQPVDEFVERLLQALVDADIEIREGRPLFRQELVDGARSLPGLELKRID